MSNVLVTGSGGFVGRVLCPMLQQRGYDVWGVDRDADGERQAAVDLCDAAAVEDLLARIKPCYIVHLAAQSSGALSFEEPYDTINNNVTPVLNLLEYARKHDGELRLLAVGSADTYGNVPSEALPLRESAATAPLNPYALSKVMQEQSCELYARLYDVDVVMTRSFNHTGAGQSDRFVLPSFVRQVAEISLGQREPKVLVGNVDVRRDFADVRDVCEAYVALLEKGSAGEIYNVCTGVSHSLRDMLERLAALAGVDIEIAVDPERVRPVDMEELRGDRSKIQNDTGWQPRLTLDDTLKDLLDYWRGRIGAAKN